MIEIFFSYAHADEELMNEVRRQLIIQERNGRIVKWYDRQIPPGDKWRTHVDARLNRARIILLFVSPHFIESKYCYEVEGKRALARHQQRRARVIPVILRPCAWHDAPFSQLQALPRDAKPISQWDDIDVASLDVANGVMKVVDELTANPMAGRKVPRDVLSNKPAAREAGRVKAKAKNRSNKGLRPPSRSRGSDEARLRRRTARR